MSEHDIVAATRKIEQLLQSQGGAALREKMGAGAPLDPNTLRMQANKVGMEAQSARNEDLGSRSTIENITQGKSADLSQADLTLQAMREIDAAVADLEHAQHHGAQETGQGVLGALPGGPSIAVASIAVEDLSQLSAPTAFSDAGREQRNARPTLPQQGK